jgi:hypothetical protein
MAANTKDALKKAEEVHAKSTPVVALDTEKSALREFCLLNLKKRSLTGTNADTSRHRETIKAAKAILEAYLSKNEITCMCLTKEQFQRAVKECPEVPPLYVRLTRGNKDATITPEIIEDAIDSVTDEDIAEHKSVIEAILHHVRNSIRTYKQTISLSDSRERNQHVYDTPSLPDDLFPHVMSWHLANLKMSEGQVKHKEALSEVTQALNAVKPIVESFFERTGVMTQRVNLEDIPYRITRKVSVRHPRIGLPKLKSLFEELQTTNLDRLRASVRPMLQNVPPVTKADVVFCAVRPKS